MKRFWGLLATILAISLAAVPAIGNQSALNVPNGTGAQVRAGFNNAIQALATLQSGPSAPSPTSAYMLWADTTNALLKQRNAADTAWITIRDLATGNAINGVPVGALQMWSTATAPSGWLLCYGQAVSRTTYSVLFAVIGTTFGVGDGSTTFNLPDLRGRMLVGLDNMGGSAANRVAAATSIGQAAGAETHSHTGGSHSHSAGTIVQVDNTHNLNPTGNLDGNNMPAAGGGTVYNIPYYGNGVLERTGYESDAATSGSTGAAGTGSTSTVSDMNPYMALSAIIKYN